MRKAFTFYGSYYQSIKELPIENQNELYKAIIEYSFEKIEPKLNGISSSIWSLIKPLLEKEEMEATRGSYKYEKWKKNILKRDNYTCCSCGSKEKLHVHHIQPFSTFPELRLIEENGITLCSICHIQVHSGGNFL